MHPYYLASKEYKSESTRIKLGNVDDEPVFVGGDLAEPVFIAGPCSIEGEESAVELALSLKELGIKVLRAMIYKPRTSPYSFQGLDKPGLTVLKKLKQATGMLLITEVREQEEAEQAAPYVSLFQIGTRNMTNFALLKKVAKMQKPIILKRGMGATIEEFLCAAEYILAQGNPNVILCERGIRTFETYTRFTLDISAVPAVKELSHLPIIVDPSHGTGKSSLVLPMARASLAAGADGVMLEVHQQPSMSKSDNFQAITPRELGSLLSGRRR